MKPIHILLVLMLLSCQTIFGKQSQTVSHPQTTTQVVSNQQETIQQLQAENKAMKEQLEDVNQKEMAKMGIIMGIVSMVLGFGLIYLMGTLHVI